MELRNRSKPISTPIHGHNIYRWIHVYDQESFAVNRSRILFFLFDFFFFLVLWLCLVSLIPICHTFESVYFHFAALKHSLGVLRYRLIDTASFLSTLIVNDMNRSQSILEEEKDISIIENKIQLKVCAFC